MHSFIVGRFRRLRFLKVLQPSEIMHSSIGSSAFYGCGNVASLVLGSGLTSIDSYAFQGWKSLTSLEIGAGVTSIATGAFGNPENLASIRVDKDNAVYDSRENCNAIIETASNTLIAGCRNTVIPGSVTAIGDNAFFYCGTLSEIKIPESVTTIGNYAFYGCSGLTSLHWLISFLWVWQCRLLGSWLWPYLY